MSDAFRKWQDRIAWFAVTTLVAGSVAFGGWVTSTLMDVPRKREYEAFQGRLLKVIENNNRLIDRNIEAIVNLRLEMVAVRQTLDRAQLDQATPAAVLQEVRHLKSQVEGLRKSPR